MAAKPANKRKRRRARKGKDAHWLKEAGWVMNFIQHLHEAPAVHGYKWKRKMLMHYAERYRALLTDIPEHCKAVADSYRKRISAILKHYTDPDEPT